MGRWRRCRRRQRRLLRTRCRCPPLTHAQLFLAVVIQVCRHSALMTEVDGLLPLPVSPLGPSERQVVDASRSRGNAVEH